MKKPMDSNLIFKKLDFHLKLGISFGKLGFSRNVGLIAKFRFQFQTNLIELINFYNP